MGRRHPRQQHAHGCQLALPVQVMGDMLLYPNSMSFDIMENGGVQPPPQGILHVTIVRIPKLSGGGDLLSKVCRHACSCNCPAGCTLSSACLKSST